VPKRTGRPWQRKKARVIRRDGGICHLCGHPGADTADHLVPWSQGGTDEYANLAAAHIDCNRRRGNRPIDVARAEIAALTSSEGWDW
jgi:5-methylcytosine-specific restriction endonuclease McrA